MNRGRATDSPNTSSIVRSLMIGSVGSIDWTMPRICADIVSTGSDVAHHDVHVAERRSELRTLVRQEIQLRSGLAGDASLLHVADDADDV